MTSDRAYELYCQGSELAHRGDWSSALPVLEESWKLLPHGKTGLWLSRCVAALDDAPMALLYAAASYAVAPRMSDVAVHFARLVHKAGDIQRAEEVLSSLQERHPDYGPARELMNAIGAKS